MYDLWHDIHLGIIMAEGLEAEVAALQAEYEWVLKEEVNKVLAELESLLVEACKRFPTHINPGNTMPLELLVYRATMRYRIDQFQTIEDNVMLNADIGIESEENLVKPEKFVMTGPSGGQQVKCIVTLMADCICEADLALKLSKQSVVPWQSKIYPENVWRLHQIQDACNHLLQALHTVRAARDSNNTSRSSAQVLRLLDDVMGCLNRGRTCLALPKRKNIEELVKNPNVKVFKPTLPNDVSLSFYVQAQKLVLAVYQLYVNNQNKIDIQARFQVECSVPWLNDTLVLFALALQQCQQLRDKVQVFAQYDAENKFLREPVTLHPILADKENQPVPDQAQTQGHGGQGRKPGTGDPTAAPNGVNSALMGSAPKLPPNLGPPPPIPPRAKEVQS